MIKIGKYNKLKVSRAVDFGLYLEDEDGNEVLIPTKYINFNDEPGTEVEVFVYLDSEGRPIATTLKPNAEVGEFAIMKVAQTNNVGAFLEWGIDKDILVPFREQKTKMRQGESYPVYVYLDDASGRIVASSKLGKFLGNLYPDYKYGEQVSLFIYEEIPIGFKAIVNNTHQGILYKDRLNKRIEVGERIKGFVLQVRDDGKIDLSLEPGRMSRSNALNDVILDFLKNNKGAVQVGDSSSPELIRELFNCSKKDFKRTIGIMYREHKIVIKNGMITLNDSRK